jgi:hypothetical protein
MGATESGAEVGAICTVAVTDDAKVLSEPFLRAGLPISAPKD